MAEVGNLSVKLSLDNAQFERSVASMNRTLQAIGQEIRGLQNKGKEWGTSIDALKQKQDAYSRLLEGQATKVKKLSQAYEDAKTKYGENSTQAEKLAVQLNKANAEMQRTERELSEVTAELKRQEDALARSQSSWNKLGETMKSAGDKLKAVGDKMSSIGKDLSMKVTAPIMALGAGAFKAATDFESAFAGVRKTVDTTEEGFAKLEKGIREMAKELPASASDIAAVAESAGQLGIAEDKILSFSRTIIDLGESTNMTREQAATEFARFANIVGMSQDNFDRLGSSIVGLGNTMATTESEIMSMGMRLAAQGKQVGMTEAEIMALAGTMSSLGIQAEMGGTAMTTILKKMQTAVLDGGAGLADFAEASQMSSEEFKKLYNTSAISALDAFAKGLATISGRGENLSEVLRDVGIKGVYESDVMMRLSGASELLAGAIDTSSTAWEENTALANEAEQRYATTASQLAMLKNKIVEMAISLGQTLIPMVMSVVDKITPMVEKFMSMEDSTKKMIIVLGGIAAAIGPVLVVLGTLVSSVGSIVTAFGGMATAIANAGGLLASIKLAFAALTGPIGLTVAAITGIGIATGLVVKELSESSFEVQEWSKGVSEATAEAVGGFVKISDDVGQSLSQLHLTSTTITSEIATEITGKFDSMYSQIVEGANTKHNEQMDSLRNYFLNSSALTDEEEKKILEKQQQSHENEMAILESKNQIVADIMKKAAEEKRELTDHERQVIDNINLQMKEDAVRVLSESEAEQKVILEKMRASADELTAQQAADVVKNAVKQKDEVIAEAEQTYDEAIKNITKMRDESGLISAEQADKMIAEAQKSRDTTIKYAEEMHDEIVAKAQEQANEHVEQVNWETGEIKSKWQVMKQDVSKKMKEIGSSIKKDWTEAYQESKKWIQKKTDTVNDKFNSIKKSITDKMGEVKTKIETKWSEAQDFLSSINLKQIGKDIVQGLINGIGDMFGNVKKKVESLANQLPQWAKDVLGIKSPSRVFKQIGKWTTEGWAIGIEDNGNMVQKAVSDIALNAKDIAEHYLSEEKKLRNKSNADISKIEKDKATKIANINKRMNEDIAKAERTAANRKKKNTQDDALKIQRIKEDAANKITKLEETSSAKIEKIRTSSTKKIVELESKMNKDLLEETKRYIDDKKSLDQLTIVEEAQIWEQSIKLFAEGTKERVKAQQEYKKATEEVNKEITAINADFQGQINKVNEELIKQEETLTKAYEDAVDKRAQSLVSFKGLFDAFKAEIDVTGEELLINLGTQIDGFKRWQQEVEKLSEKAIDEGLLEELRQMGPNALPQLIALNQLTDTQLKQYSNLYKEKSQLARKQAETELKGMKKDTDKQIKDLRSVADKQLTALEKEWNGKIKSITDATATEFSNLEQVGIDAGNGLLQGLSSTAPSIEKKAREIANSVSKTIQNALKIKSPSRVTMGFGENVGEGLVIGMEDKIKQVVNAGKKLASAVTQPMGMDMSMDSMRNAASKTIDNSRTYKNGDTNIYVYGNNPSPSEIARKALQAQRQQAMEWGV